MEARERLEKSLKPHWVWAIAFGSAVGWGSFVLPADWIAMSGPLAVIVGFAIGALLMIVIGVNYGFLIKLYPVAGGEFCYAYVGFGRNHAYICGWFLTLGYLSIVALNASALALLGRFLVPGLTETGLLYSVAGWDVYLGEVIIASLSLIIFAIVNVRGASFSGQTQFVFCVLLIAGAVLVLVGMLLSPETSFDNLDPLFKPGVPAWSSILVVVAIAPWAYVGFDNIPQAAEEFDFPPAKALQLIVLALLLAAVHYSILVVATSLAMPWTDLVNQKHLWATGAVVQGALGTAGMALLAISLCMGIFTGLNGFYMATSRLLFAMSRARILPPAFGSLHRVHRTPFVSIVFVCAICLLAPWFGRQVLLWIVDMAAVGVAIAYFYTCAVAYKHFKWSEGDGEQPADVRSANPTKKCLAMLGAVSGICFLGLLLVPYSPGFLSKPSLVALIIWTGIGVAFYVVRGRQYQQVPKSELDHFILDMQDDVA